MPSAFALRNQIETALANRIPSALSIVPRIFRPVAPTGIRVLDGVSDGGFPLGAITELVGPQCSGRTSAALAYLSAITQSGSVCAWIDVADALDPEAAAANGVDLERLLWVRCGLGQPSSPALSGDSQNVPSLAAGSTPRHNGGGSPHPRSEGRDMPQAIGALLQAHGGLYDKQLRREKKAIGTPGGPNRPLSNRSDHREEQVNSDRLPPRRGDNLAIAPRCAEPQPRRIASLPSGKRLAREHSSPRDLLRSGAQAASSPWQALDQALRATDLLLQSGGFSSIILDLGSTRPEFAWRIPLATWFRFRAACERTRVSLLLLTQHPCARSSAELVVRLHTGSMEAQSKVMTGIRYRAETERSRSGESRGRIVPIRKPPQSERPGEWRSEVSWAQAK